VYPYTDHFPGWVGTRAVQKISKLSERGKEVVGDLAQGKFLSRNDVVDLLRHLEGKVGIAEERLVRLKRAIMKSREDHSS